MATATATTASRDRDSSSADEDIAPAHMVVPVAPVASEDGTHSAAATRLRHGRGPIIQDDDDDLDDPEAALVPSTTTAAVDDHQGGDDDDDDDRKPLLANGNGKGGNGNAVHKRRRGRGGSSCASVCCIALSTLFISFLIVLALAHLWIGHLMAEEQRRHAHESAEQIVQRGLLVAGPSAIRVVTPPPSEEGGNNNTNVVVVEMDVVMGMDVRKALGWQDKDATITPKNVGWRARMEAKLARWAVSRADHVNVRVHGLALYPEPEPEPAEPTTNTALSNKQTPPPLVRIDDPSALAFSLPLSYPSPNDMGDEEGLRTETYTFTIPLTFPEPKQLVEFGKRVWDEKRYRVRTEIEQVVVVVGGGAESGTGSGGKKKKNWGGGKGLERWFMDKFVSRPRTVDDIVRVVQGQLPEMPAFPPQNPTKMVELVSLSVFESPSPLLLSSSVVPPTTQEDSPHHRYLVDDGIDLATQQKKEKEEVPNPSPEETVIAFAVSALLQNPLREAIKSGRIPPVAWSMPFRLPIEISLPLPPAPVVVSTPLHQGEGGGGGGGEEPEIALARVSLAPFGFGEMDRQAELSLTGYVVPAGNLTPSNPPSPPTRDPSEHEHSTATTTTTTTTAPQAPLSRALSRFVARYLSGRSNDVFIRYDSSGKGPHHSSPPPTIPSDPAKDAPLPPRFVADLVRDQVMKVSVPGTNETPELFKDLRMEDMKVKLGGRGGDGNDDADLLASGRVVGEVVLPEMAQGLAEGIDAKWIWPDVLVYEGDLPRSIVPAAAAGDSDAVAMSPTTMEEVSSSQVVLGAGLATTAPPDDDNDDDDDDDDDSVTQYPPSPIPATAFARMRPSSSMTAETIHLPANGTHAARTLVSAHFVDAPLYLLPGRGDVLRRFVGKIIFGGKATASMKGLTSVRIGLSGFGEVELVEIPIEASFLVGRGGVQNPPSLAELVGLA